MAAFDDDDGVKADLIDGSIGEASMFHESFGFYVQGDEEWHALTAFFKHNQGERLIEVHERRGEVENRADEILTWD